MGRKNRQKGKNSDDDGDDNDGDLGDDYTIADDDEFGGGGGGGDDLDFDQPLGDDYESSDLNDDKFRSCLSGAAEIPYEKKGKTRLQAYKNLFRALSQYSIGENSGEILESSLDSVVGSCLAGLRNSAPEQYACCRCLEVLSILLGNPQDEYFSRVSEPLRVCVRAMGNPAMVRSAALRALSMCAFICCSDQVEGDKVMDLCEECCKSKWRGTAVPSALRSSALMSWGLLATTIGDGEIASSEGGRGVEILSILQSCLEESDAELRSSAGECFALIHESRLNLGLTNTDEMGSETNATSRRYRSGSWDGSDWETLIDEVRQRMSELSVESGHHLSKKAKKLQRSTFREYMSTVCDDEPPEITVKFPGGSLTLTSWREIKQLDFVRHCLQSGFLPQMMNNETLQEIFGADPDVLNDSNLTKLGRVDKRLLLSKNSDASKQSTKDMKKKRGVKENRNNYYED